MPGLRVAVANGNWSNSAIWDNGVLPSIEDDVASNGFTITIDQDANIRQITNAARDNVGYTLLMTSNTTPAGYVVAASSQAAGNEAYRAFDQNTSTSWRSAGISLPTWISYQFSSSVIINRYGFRGAVSGYLPHTWQFQGSNDNSNWTVLESKTTSSPGANNWYYSPLLGNATSYLYYRIYITATAVAGNQTDIGEIRLYETTSTALSGSAGGGFIITGSRNIICTDPSIDVGSREKTKRLKW